ncbi:MAG: hypothetical protein MRJ96_13550 [Nitrospirales bacterium]|nr:hypothetical protein [Nitrospira sp.]MDR4502470.1 hypothetical protein [Nitrospirales bacterium]
MTTFFPMTKATLGLSITRESLCLVEIRRSWNRVTCRAIAERFLPPNVVRLSPTRPNIEDMNAFTHSLKSLVEHLSRPQSVALSLPDVCGRTTILTFSSLPAKQTEQDSLVRWKFQQDMNVVPDQTRFAYRVFSHSKEPTSPKRVLATAVQHDILEQYEQACLEVGLLPNSVGLSGLDACEYFQPTMQSLNQRIKNQARELTQEHLFVYFANWGFWFIAFQDNHPTFIRVKSLPLPRVHSQEHLVAETDSHASTLSEAPDIQHDTGNQVFDDYSPLQVNHVSNELAATLQYYFESQPHAPHDQVPIPLYVAEGLWHGDRLLPTEETVATLLATSSSYAPPVRISRVSDMLSPKLRRTILRSEPQMTSFSAFASAAVLS